MDWFKAIIAIMWTVAIIFLMYAHNEPISHVYACSDLPTYCEVLPRGLDLLIFSMGINAGTGRSVKLLQQSLGCVPDGVIGSRTMELVKQSNVADLIGKFSQARRQYYESLKTFPIFGKGWLARVDREESEALNMAKNG